MRACPRALAHLGPHSCRHGIAPCLVAIRLVCGGDASCPQSRCAQGHGSAGGAAGGVGRANSQKSNSFEVHDVALLHSGTRPRKIIGMQADSCPKANSCRCRARLDEIGPILAELGPDVVRIRSRPMGTTSTNINHFGPATTTGAEFDHVRPTSPRDHPISARCRPHSARNRPTLAPEFAANSTDFGASSAKLSPRSTKLDQHWH